MACLGLAIVEVFATAVPDTRAAKLQPMIALREDPTTRALLSRAYTRRKRDTSTISTSILSVRVFLQASRRGALPAMICFHNEERLRSRQRGKLGRVQ